MDIIKCRICTEPLFASEKPTHCPFCGSGQKNLVAATDFEPEPIAELSDKSRQNLLRAVELAVSNCQFYRGASKVADTPEGEALFSGLARLEGVHVTILSRILEQDLPEDLNDTGECSPSHLENLKEGRRREERSLHFYQRFLDESDEERVRMVLEAFLQTETDHVALTNS